MTAPAPRNHPAEDAHPAPAVAPVAVPEAAVEAALVAHSDSELNPKSNGTEEDMRHALTAALPHLTPRENARPEPVVAPLPSGAVEAAGRAASEAIDSLPYEREDYSDEHTWRVAGEAALTAALPYLRLVPEDDEDTVRVPRDSLTAMLHAQREWSTERPVAAASTRMTTATPSPGNPAPAGHDRKA